MKLQEGSVATLQQRVLSQQSSRGFCHNTTRGYCHNATREFCHNSTVEGSGLPVTQAAPANQNIAQNVPCEKLLEWPPCSADKLKQTNRVSNCWILDKTFKVRNVTHVLDNARQHLLLNETNYVHLKIGISLRLLVFHQPTQYNMVMRQIMFI